MSWKILIALIIFLTVTGAILFSERGREFKTKYLDKYLGNLGSYLKVLRSKVEQRVVNRTLQLSVSTNPSSLMNQEFSIDRKNFRARLKFESATIAGHPLTVEDGEIELDVASMSGSILFNDGKIKVYGSASYIRINDMKLSPKTGEEQIEFFVLGEPLAFSLQDIEKSELKLSKASGILKVNDLSPLALEEDDLSIKNFKGSLELENDEIIIKGYAESVTLNGVKLLI